ncbi:MAG: phospholipid carrier-dependent glycosyltransferase, partial [Armatimonadetes bacterium]|nr:phospholipid carrier-dependent glycosyltransferase [Armatimonadota bacterium]
MISVLLASSVWALGTGLGALVAAPMGRGRWTRTETTLFSAAIGLGGIAYAVFAIGLVGSLNRTALAVLGAAAAVPACVGLLSLLRYRHETQPAERSTRGGAWFAASAAVILAVTACAALLDCFVPPGAHEWDSLSYHLATPQAYLRAGRIVELPTDHHSYFPFLTQMLFTVGLMFDGFATAKLIHFMFGAMACMAAYAMARRLTSATGAWLAALVFGLAPMVVWEAGIAYIELAQTFFVTLALHALLIWARSRDQRDLAACGACCGLALAVKTLSLLPVVGVVVAALVTEPRAHRALALVGVTALVGSPFYIRTWLLTGNPVYPFAYGVFGGRNWDAERARAYASEHTSFGLNAALPALSDDLRPTRAAYARPSMSDRLRNLALAPFALVASPRIFHNYNDPTPYASLGFLWLALLPLAVLGGARDPAALMLAGILAVWYLAWSGSMQYMRYLIPALPALAAVGASGAIRLGRRSGPVRWAVIAAVAVQVIVLWGHAIPRAAAQAPLAWSPDLAETFLSRRMNVYESQRRL